MKILNSIFLSAICFWGCFISANETPEKCQRAFSYLSSQSEVQRFFSDKAHLKRFKNQEGYLLFCEIYNYKDMLYVFRNVSQALGKTFKALNWQVFQGSLQEFSLVRAEILDNQGNFKREYRGMEGYAQLADQFYNGKMFRAFKNVSAVLDKRVFKQSGWQAFSGSTQSFRLVRAEVLDSQGNFKKEYRGMEGYAQFTDKFYNGNMSKAFKNVSAVLDKRVFKQSGWQVFIGLTQSFRLVRAEVLDSQGNFKEEYRGMEAYALFADTFYQGDMSKAFKNVSAMLDKRVFKQSGWQVFIGLTQEFRKLRTDILDTQGNFKKEYRGMEGYAQFADKFYNGNMSKAFINVSAVLDKRVFKQSGWQKFDDSTQNFRLLRAEVLDNQGNFKEEYRGMEGYAQLADQFYNGEMFRTFQNVSASFGGYKNISPLEWKFFFGTSSQYHKLIQLFKDSSLGDLSGLNGQQKVARLIFNGHTVNTYKNVSTLRNILFVNPEEDWSALKWSKRGLS